jgi:uncharacterized membrane-anchored protein
MAGGDLRSFVAKALLGAAVAQALASILFFFAANWWGMAPPLKLGLIDAALLGCALGAALSANGSFGRAAFAVSGSVVSGILFAVHGQIWQTGANAWELFAVWSGAAALWAMAGRVDAVWIVLALVAGLAAYLAGLSSIPVGLVADAWIGPVASAVPLLVLLLRWGWSRCPGQVPPAAWMTPVLLGMTAITLLFTGLFHLDDDRGAAVLGLMAGGLGMVLLRPARFGPVPLVIAALLAVVLAEALVIDAVLDGLEAAGLKKLGWRLLLAAGIVMIGVYGLARLLRRLFGSVVIAPERIDMIMTAIIGTGAWIGIGVVAVAGGLVLSLMGLSDYFGLEIAALAGLGALLHRGDGHYARQTRAALVFGVFAGLVYEIMVVGDSVTLGAAGATLLLAVLLVLTPNAAAGLFATATTLVLVSRRLVEFGPWGVAVLTLASAALGWLLLEHRRPSVAAAALYLLAAAFAVAAGAELALPDAVWPARIGASLAATGLMAAALWHRRELARPPVIAAGLLAVAGALLVPAGAAGVVGLTAAASRRFGRPLVALGFGMAAWSVVWFYHDQEVPLAFKALMLAEGAALTLVAWLVAAGRGALGRPGLQPVPALLLLLCAIVPAVVEAADGWRKAAIMESGREVLLPLRPVDPRSLVQGDFMALAYARHLTAGLPSTGGTAYLRVNADGEAWGTRRADGPPVAGEIAVHVRQGRREARLAPDSFLFQEGTGKDWARARFAVVRIADGDLVLSGLADEQRQPIRPLGQGLPSP